jgi:ribosomal protein L22
MTQNLIIRGFDDKVHAQLGELAQERGVSINSIVKDAVDKWLKQQQQSQIPRKHHLVIHSDNQSMMGLLKSMDRLAKEGDLFRCFFGPPDSPSTELLSKLKWYDGTVEPYCYPPSSTSSSATSYQDRHHQQQQQQVQSQKDIMKYCGKVMENIAKNANNKQVCCMDFLINDIAKTSLKQALTIEESYNNDRIAGLMYCTYKTETLLNSEIKDMIELFEIHDQIFILKDDEVYKLHVTKENVHKLFLN